jgi:hypothetical protein
LKLKLLSIFLAKITFYNEKKKQIKNLGQIQFLPILGPRKFAEWEIKHFHSLMKKDSSEF